MERQLTVDFNRAVDGSLIRANTRRANAGIACVPGSIIVVGDDAHPERILEGAIIVTGDADDPVFARVASLTERPTGVKVHLEILPGDPLEYVEAMRRSHLLTA